MTSPSTPSMPFSASSVAHSESHDAQNELVRRQLVLTTLALAVLGIVLAFVHTQGSAAAAHASTPVDHYVQAHRPPNPGSLHLAYLQLVAAAAVAIVALGHAARVAAYVFRRKAL